MISSSVRVGSSKHASGGIIVDVKRIINHENYSKIKFDFDIALIELAEALNFTERIQSIQLSSIDDNIADGTLCRVSGWGATENSTHSDDLLAAFVPIVNQDTCSEIYGIDEGDDKICAGSESGDTGGGDSGGPLMCFNDESRVWKLVGVTSFGHACGHSEFPGVYARVQAVRSWIENFTGI